MKRSQKDIEEEMQSCYELIDYFAGQEYRIRVFLVGGAVLSGKIMRRTGKFVLIENKEHKRTAMFNMDHITSATRM